MSENAQAKSESPAQSPSAGGQEAAGASPKPPIDKRAKLVFLAVVLLVGAIIWWVNQRGEAEIPGWNDNFTAALALAKAKKVQILVFFSDSPMSYNDKVLVDKAMNTYLTKPVLDRKGYAKVHLNLDKHKALAQQYGVTSAPTVLLLDSDGKEIRRQTQPINDVTFCNSFLGVPLKETN